MKMKLIIPLLSMALAAPVVAEKPEWAGKGKPTQEQKEAHQLAMDAKEGEQEKLKLEKDKKDKKDKKEKKDNTEKVSGIEKQTEKKSTQVQKELDKGSDKGKESREKSKKWWKFWGE